MSLCPIVHHYAKPGRGFVYPEYASNYPPEYNYEVKNYLLHLTVDFDRRSVTGRSEIHIRLLKGQPGWIELDASEMRIYGVSVDGRPVEWDYDGRRLKFKAERPELIAEIEYSATPRKGLHFVLPDKAHPQRYPQVWSQGETNYNRYWMPLPDHPVVKFPNELVVRVPREMVVISNGDLISKEVDGGSATWHYKMRVPHSGYLISLVAGVFEEIVEQGDGYVLRYFVTPGWRSNAHLSFSKTRKMIDFFSDYLGYRYPFNSYSQVTVAEFIFGGMENTTATTLTELTLHDEKAHADFSSDPLVAHEAAHQWFGDLVTCKDWSHIWINESMATFLENLFVRYDKGEDEFVYELVRDMDSYLEEYRNRYARPIVTRVYKFPSELFDAHAYPKGGLIVNTLRSLLGEEVFRKGLNLFLKRFEYRVADTDDFRKVMEEVSGRNLERFFEQFFYNAGHPSLKVQEKWDEERGLLTLKIKQTQSDDSLEAYWLPIKVEIKMGDLRESLQVELSEREETIVVPLKRRPDYVCVDPHFEVFKTLEYERSDEVWGRVLREEEHVYCRILAARALGKLGGPVAIEALREAVLKDPFWGVAAEAARALGECGGEMAKSSLLECLRSVKNPRVKRALCDALGHFRDEDVAMALTEVLMNDEESYYVRQSAAISLGKKRDGRYRDVLLKVIDKPSHNHSITVGVLRGLSEIGDEESLRVIIRYTRDDVPTVVRAAAIICLGRFSLNKEIIDVLTHAARSENFRIRQAVIAACRETMSPEVLPVLNSLVDDVYEMNRRSARDVSEKIRSHMEKGSEYRMLREEVEKLREENRKLVDRMTLISKTVELKG
ncbi:MAG: HEAT repeat domain-containing protein [Aigarchaeota archaeon]|nr:HEAT repeat domain-containing protein [Aigarchaeota archaeon]MDW8092846.1 HEAT repeat domain-containing protein [Nitrososphaerota archaeon]